ncbi:MAG: SufD family Fe-S cluster assembly protein [Rickettsiales bacterium]|jgi:Fe-S cluster assembly scaffold protein SufB|nr:SufD family Fe-S cluster assembly protein [Rickettsiales bacterium]
MNYLWEQFAVPVFKARTAVFLGGAFRADLSDLGRAVVQGADIEVFKDDLPLHIIMQGAAAENLRVVLNEDAGAYMSGAVTDLGAVDVVARGTGAKLQAGLFLENKGSADIKIKVRHEADNTLIKVRVHIEAGVGSETLAEAEAIMGRGVKGAESLIGFKVLADEKLKSLKISPNQKISSAEVKAGHEAATFGTDEKQIIFLSEAGLDNAEARAALREAFRNETFSHLPV